jgi:hypothetical protein
MSIHALKQLQITEPGLNRKSPDSFLLGTFWSRPLLLDGGIPMSKETPNDSPRKKTDSGSHAQTEKPWKGNPEKEQRNDGSKIDLEKWHESGTH